jgi:hypothetical protein
MKYKLLLFFFSSTTVRCGFWLPIQFSSFPDGQLYRLLNKFVFTGFGYQPNAQHPTWRIKVSLVSGTSLLTCPAWETLPVATLQPA